MSLWMLAASAWDARRKPGDGPPPRVGAEGYAVQTGAAEIEVVGVIGSDDSWWWGRMCDPARIAAAVRAADADPSVSEIRLIIDSPGGSGSAMRDAHLALRACSKPTSAYITGQCLSAAYWIASGCRHISAHPLAMVGCVGTIVRASEWQGSDDLRKTLRSAQTPDKAPDLSSEQWDAQWQAVLDEMTSLFLGDIAAGRGWGADVDVAARVQRGATLAASAALAAGLVDEVADAPGGRKPAPATSSVKPAARAGTRPTRTAQGAAAMEELEKVTKERDDALARIAELEAELAKLKGEEEAEAAEGEAKAEAAEAMARIAKLEASLATERRDRYLDARVAAGEIPPGARKSAEKLFAVGGAEEVEAVFPKGRKAIPTPIGHGGAAPVEPAAAGDNPRHRRALAIQAEAKAAGKRVDYTTALQRAAAEG